MRALLALCTALFALGVSAQGTIYPTTLWQYESFVWGAEAWLLGPTDDFVRIDAPGPVEIVSIVGNVTAAPLYAANPNDLAIRQTLMTVLDPQGAGVPKHAKVIGTSPGTNHSVTPHLYNANIKQVGLNVVTQPVNIQFAVPRRLVSNILQLHWDNGTYRCPGGYCATSANPNDAIDVEWQVVVTYRWMASQ